MAEEDEDKQPIIIKKVNKSADGHHGGAWKVAYADFVTAMMAFFLLLWLLNVTTDEQKNAISNYFDPAQPKIATSQSGAGGILGGTSVSREGAMTQNTQPIENKRTEFAAVDAEKKDDMTDKELEKEIRKREEKRFEKAEEELKQAIQETPELKELEEHLKIDRTPEGLRIQIIDREGKPMFDLGSAQMKDKTHKLLKAVSKIIRKMPNQISIKGHTDAIPYRGDGRYTNWELSSDRANASRKILTENGVPQDRIFSISGKAATEPLIQENPKDPKNRRISIILLRDSIVRQALKNAGIEPEERLNRSEMIENPRLSPGRRQFP